MNRFLGLSALLVGAALLSFGCAQKNDSSDELVVWHWMTDRQDALDQLARQYETQTGTKVRFELYAPSDVYSQKVVAAAQARVLPDIFGVLDKKSVLASFIEAGHIADLTGEFQRNSGAWEKIFSPKALAINRFDEGNVQNVKPGIYGVPIDVTNIQMLYNKNLLLKAGLTAPPKTFDELLEAVRALKRVGVPGIVSGWGELWLVDCFASNYAFNIMGEEKIMATYRGDVPYTDPDWLKVFEVFKVLREEGALIEGIVTKSNKYAEQDFALERAAFAFNGSWCVNVYHEMNPNLEYGVMLPPAVNPALPMKIWGGAGSSFMVNNNSAKKDKAVAFLKWLTAQQQQIFLSRETNNLPSNNEALTSVSAVLSEFAGAMDATTHHTSWVLNEHPLVSEAFDRGIQSIIIGEKTPEQVAEEVRRVKVRELERAKQK